MFIVKLKSVVPILDESLKRLGITTARSTYMLSLGLQLGTYTWIVIVCLTIRFGSFEIFKAMDPTTGRTGPSVGQTELPHQLTDYVIQNFYPEVSKHMYISA